MNTLRLLRNLSFEMHVVCYIPFNWSKDFEKEYLDYIRYYCLVMSEDYIRNHFADIKRYANVIENRLDDEGCTLESVIKDNCVTIVSCEILKPLMHLKH